MIVLIKWENFHNLDLSFHNLDAVRIIWGSHLIVKSPYGRAFEVFRKNLLEKAEKDPVWVQSWLSVNWELLSICTIEKVFRHKYFLESWNDLFLVDLLNLWFTLSFPHWLVKSQYSNPKAYFNTVIESHSINYDAVRSNHYFQTGER